MINFQSATLLLLAATHALADQTETPTYDDIVGFTPLTDVRDQLRIDLDQQAMEELLELATDEGFTQAEAIYRNGGFSKTVATLTIPDGGLNMTIPKGTRLTNGTVTVFAYEDGLENATTFLVQYVDEGCYVGSNPEPVTTGCLPASGELTTVEGSDVDTKLTYVHDILLDTGNVYSIANFTRSSEFLFPDRELTADFQKFVDFYGSESYADDIITAALTGEDTKFSTGKDLLMSGYGYGARAEIASKASAYMAVWMYVIREMEHAIYLCETGDCEENSCFGKPAVHEVDEAVAFYAGSLEGKDGSGDGVLTYNLADHRAADFKTAGSAGDSIDGTAKANLDIIEVFQQASANIVAANCSAVRNDTTRLVQLMTIPLVQGTLRYTYLTANAIVDPEDPEDPEELEESEAERAIFAASVLPFVAACNADDADQIYEMTKTGSTTTNFTAVKMLFENNYNCMNITTADIGGLWNSSANAYYEGAAPTASDVAIAKTVDVTANNAGAGGTDSSSSSSGGGSSSSGSSSSTTTSTSGQGFTNNNEAVTDASNSVRAAVSVGVVAGITMMTLSFLVWMA